MSLHCVLHDDINGRGAVVLDLLHLDVGGSGVSGSLYILYVPHSGNYAWSWSSGVPIQMYVS